MTTEPDNRPSYTRSTKRVEHYDGRRKKAKAVSFLCGHGKEYSYASSRKCGICVSVSRDLGQF